MEQLELPLVEKQEEKKINLNNLKTGYIVALSLDGNFIFEPIGKYPGLIELLGLHQLAKNKLSILLNQIVK